MLVYAADLDYSILDSYYKRGSTRADLEICYFDQHLSKQKSGWLPIARFRLIHLLESCKKQGFLILDLRNRKNKDLEKFTTFIQTPSVKKLAEILADKYPQSIEFDDLKEELEEFRNSELRATLKKAKEEKEAKEKANISEQCDSGIGEKKEQDSTIVRISEWKGKLCQILKKQSGTENSIIVHDKKYRLEHSFILVQERYRD